MRLLQSAEMLEKTAALQAADASGKILAHSFSKVSEYHHGERYPEDDSEKEPARRDLADIMAHKWQDHIPGGLAEGKKPSDFPSADLVLGMTVEMEHTSDPSIACEIAMDHLTEKSDYYRKGDMAKEVAESLGKVEDGSITLAKQAGVLMACMSKEAWNPLGAMKKLVTPALGSLARPMEGAALKGVAGGAEHAMGKVLPMARPSNLSHADTVMRPSANSMMATRPDIASASLSPGSGNVLVNKVNAAQQQASNQRNLHGAVSQAQAQAKAKLPGAPTRVMDIPEGNAGPGRVLGADEWIASHPKEALKNRLLSDRMQSVKTIPGRAAPGQVQSPPAAGPAAAATGPVTGGSMGGDAGFHSGPPGAPPPTGANPVGSVASPGPAVKRFGWGKALAVGGLGAGAYGAAKAIPWAARQVEQTSAMPLAYGGGWSPTPYGYGSTPYGSGVQTMGPGA